MKKHSDDRITGHVDTVLAQWLRAASPVQREELANKAGTSVGYLRLLAGAHRENPKLRLAMAIVDSAFEIRWRDTSASECAKLPVLSLADLATPTRYKVRD